MSVQCGFAVPLRNQRQRINMMLKKRLPRLPLRQLRVLLGLRFGFLDEFLESRLPPVRTGVAFGRHDKRSKPLAQMGEVTFNALKDLLSLRNEATLKIQKTLMLRRTHFAATPFEGVVVVSYRVASCHHDLNDL